MTKIWRNDIQNCPLNKRVHFLCDYAKSGMVLHEVVGTLTINPYTGTVGKGLCLEGSQDVFYKSNIVMWCCYETDEEAECLY